MQTHGVTDISSVDRPLPGSYPDKISGRNGRRLVASLFSVALLNVLTGGFLAYSLAIGSPLVYVAAPLLVIAVAASVTISGKMIEAEFLQRLKIKTAEPGKQPSMTPSERPTYPLRGKAVTLVDPFEPVSIDEWTATS